MERLTASEARGIALAAQGFGARRTAGVSGWPAMAAALDRLAVLQLDSVTAVCRSHYLPLFARLGPYDRAVLDRRARHGPHRALMEYWAHEASLIPVAMQPLFRWRMARARDGKGVWSGIARFGRENAALCARVLDWVGANGPVTARALPVGAAGTGPWWGWGEGKQALEWLFWTGALTSAGRQGGFERLYDLPERCLPAEVLRLPTPSDGAAAEALVLRAARALGVAMPADLRDYWRMPPDLFRPALARLLERGELRAAAVAGREGWVLDPLADGPAPKPTCLLSPFDSLVFDRTRTERLFGFRYRLEFYVPEARRRFGYYVMPLMLRGRLVGRADLRADRAAGRLRALSWHPEPRAPRDAADAARAETARLADWLGLRPDPE
ncbi:MAG: winged helix-turn-helix domain-containing protein [Hasllibacter sp.]